MRTARYALFGALTASAAIVGCGILAYLLSPFRLSEIFAMPLFPGCIIGYLFIYGDAGENGRAELWATIVSVPFTRPSARTSGQSWPTYRCKTATRPRE